MDLYAKLARATADTIARFGTPITTRRLTASSFDPVASSTSTTYSELVRKGLISKVTSQLLSEVHKIGNSNILITDIVVIFGPDGDTNETDTIMVDSIPHQVVAILPIKPAASIILVKVVVRR